MKSFAEDQEWPAGESTAEAFTPIDELKRRSFLKLMAASVAAAGLSGCTRQPIEELVPYVRQPEKLVPGEPLYFATAMPLSGYGTGILVKSREGRPIKADGNPLHPASGGGSSVWIQACLLDLYNPARAKAVQQHGEPTSYARFESWLHERVRAERTRKGAGIRILTGCVTSPTVAWQMKSILELLPEARWHQWEPINWDNAMEGARVAFGENLATHYRVKKAAVIASFECDFLYTHPERLRHTREFADGRRVVAGQTEMNRLYVLESSPTVTGSMADHRLPLSPARVEGALYALARELGVTVPEGGSIDEEVRHFVHTLARDLEANRGKSLILAGESLAPESHALAQAINEHLGNFGITVQHSPPAQAEPVLHAESLRRLGEEIESGAVDLLVILAGNPAATAPADFDFAARLQRVKNSVHLTTRLNETSRLCQWQIPQAHFLETWSDIRSYDGTATIMQPLIAPLFSGVSQHELLNGFLEEHVSRSGYETVREYWRSKGRWDDFETGWQTAVHDGIIRDSAAELKRPKLRDALEFRARTAPPELELSFRPDPHLWDGEFEDNPWLQEAPKPLSKISWGSAAMISPEFARGERLETGDQVRLGVGGRAVEIPVFVLPGQSRHTITLHLPKAYPLRRADALWDASAVTLERLDRREAVVTTQSHYLEPETERQVYRDGTLAQFRKNPQFVSDSTQSPEMHETLYNPHDYDYPVKWGMAIDLTTCVGCNACIMACNIENNIPIVGRKEVANNREMLWLRVDTYFSGNPARPKFNHQPVPCMHCENAPCEYVCPVEATLHDHEGLNLQIYNRCVGTRYCSNNCPYKVRRFNFYKYSDYSSDLRALQYNPEVTVRWRGVMEKCTYCVQRIAAGRIRSKEENRAIRDGEVKTACAEACPASAIVFGIMSDKESRVSQAKRHPLDYSMLGQLNTRPRTTYSAKLRNPNPAMES